MCNSGTTTPSRAKNAASAHPLTTTALICYVLQLKNLCQAADPNAHTGRVPFRMPQRLDVCMAEIRLQTDEHQYGSLQSDALFSFLSLLPAPLLPASCFTARSALTSQDTGCPHTHLTIRCDMNRPASSNKSKWE